MGGLRRRMPFAFVAMAVGTLAIIGVPGFSGFFSKDAVIYGTLEHGHPLLYAVAVITAGITAYYMFRMLFVAFFGDVSRRRLRRLGLGMAPRAGLASRIEPTTHAHAHAARLGDAAFRSRLLMVGIGRRGLARDRRRTAARGAGFSARSSRHASAPVDARRIPEIASTLLVLAVVALGFAVAYVRYGIAARDGRMPSSGCAPNRCACRPILTHAFYFDAAIDAAVRAARARDSAALFARFVDPHVIDAGVRDVVWLTGAAGLPLPRASRRGSCAHTR